MKYLKCINNLDNCLKLTIGKIYISNSEFRNGGYIIINDLNCKQFYHFSRFVDVTRSLKIKRLL